MKNSTRTFGVKARAILAGSLVLGVGAAVTLASWNDSEFAAGAFTGGKYNIQSSLNGTSWADATSAKPAALAFTVGPGTLSPNTTVYAPFAVKLAPGTTNASDLTVKSVGTAGISSNLSYSIVRTSAWGCDATTTGSPVVSPGTATLVSTAANVLSLAEGATTAYLCVAVTAGPGLVQGSTGNVTWEFSGISGAALTTPAV